MLNGMDGSRILECHKSWGRATSYQSLSIMRYLQSKNAYEPNLRRRRGFFDRGFQDLAFQTSWSNSIWLFWIEAPTSIPSSISGGMIMSLNSMLNVVRMGECECRLNICLVPSIPRKVETGIRKVRSSKSGAVQQTKLQVKLKKRY